MTLRVAVVGAGWSGLAVASFLDARGVDVTLLESSDRPGGRIRTLRQEGCLVEAGPHGVIPRHEATAQLLERAGVPLLRAPPDAPRLVVHRGRPTPLPTRPPDLLRTRLLSPAAKLRLLAEPLRRAGSEGESVEDFAARRLGRGVAHLVDAFTTGVHAGDPARLSLAHAFPELRRMDQSGGLLRGLKRPQGARPTLTTAADGMEGLVAGLASRLRVRYRTPVRGLREGAEGVAVGTDAGEERFDRVVVATDPAATARILGLAAQSPPVAPVRIVAFSLPQERAHAVGYGVLAPEREGRFLLGALFESSLFAGRAPPGYALLRCLVGGRRHPERAALPENEVAARAWEDLRGLGLVSGEPASTFHLPTEGIPQAEAGHDAWLRALPRSRVRVLGIGHGAVGLDALASQAQALAEEWAGAQGPR